MYWLLIKQWARWRLRASLCLFIFHFRKYQSAVASFIVISFFCLHYSLFSFYILNMWYYVAEQSFISCYATSYRCVVCPVSLSELLCSCMLDDVMPCFLCLRWDLSRVTCMNSHSGVWTRMITRCSPLRRRGCWRPGLGWRRVCTFMFLSLLFSTRRTLLLNTYFILRCRKVTEYMYLNTKVLFTPLHLTSQH